MSVSMSDYRYGTAEYGQELQAIAYECGFTPISNMLEWSKEYYNQHVNVWPATLLHFITMIIDKESNDEAVVAGWIFGSELHIDLKEKN